MVYNVTDIIVRIILIFILFVIAILFLKIYQANRYEKRISKYTLKGINNYEISYLDRFYNWFIRFRHNITLFLKKIKIFDNYSKKYEQYTDKTKIIPEEEMDYISNKIIVGFIAIIIIVLSDIFQYNSITIYQLILSFLIGFFIPDLFLFGKKKYLKKRIEADILKAVIIMNNAFKSGRSTMQAIKIVSEELDGPIAEEYKKMYIDLTFGLSIENTFKRFAKRVDIEEVRYITTSLTILNKTGGNIVKVFSSIERSFFNRKKMEEELKSLTASSNALFWILISIPIFIVLLIILSNIISNSSNYFLPLFQSFTGFVLLFTMILIYVLYIIIVRRVMKLR